MIFNATNVIKDMKVILKAFCAQNGNINNFIKLPEMEGLNYVMIVKLNETILK